MEKTHTIVTRYADSLSSSHYSVGFLEQQKQKTVAKASKAHKDTCTGKGTFQVPEAEDEDLQFSH